MRYFGLRAGFLVLGLSASARGSPLLATFPDELSLEHVQSSKGLESFRLGPGLLVSHEKQRLHQLPLVPARQRRVKATASSSTTPSKSDTSYPGTTGRVVARTQGTTRVVGYLDIFPFANWSEAFYYIGSSGSGVEVTFPPSASSSKSKNSTTPSNIKVATPPNSTYPCFGISGGVQVAYNINLTALTFPLADMTCKGDYESRGESAVWIVKTSGQLMANWTSSDETFLSSGTFLHSTTAGANGNQCVVFWTPDLTFAAWASENGCHLLDLFFRSAG